MSILIQTGTMLAQGFGVLAVVVVATILFFCVCSVFDDTPRQGFEWDRAIGGLTLIVLLALFIGWSAQA